ncbi:MAG: VOC family protein [Pseudoxanthomonas sp.]
MIHHVDIAVSNIDRSETFYSHVLRPLGMELLIRNESNQFGGRSLGFGVLADPIFWIRSDSPPSVRVHLAFVAPTRAAVDAFHAAALSGGGSSLGSPGLREQYGDGYYAAFVGDPDGNNIEAVYRKVAV